MKNNKLSLVVFNSLSIILLIFSLDIQAETRENRINDNQLKVNLSLAAQKDSQYIHLSNGDILRFKERYNSHGHGDLLNVNKPFAIERRNADFYLVGVRSSSSQYSVGTVEKLDSNWKARDKDLFRAVFLFCCDSEWIKELINRGANPEVKSYRGSLPIHYLSRQIPYGTSFEKALKVLVDSGININALTDDGNTALSIAISNYSSSSKCRPENSSCFTYLKSLLDLGADPNFLSSPPGQTPPKFTPPLNQSLWNRDFEVAKLLLAYNADPRLKDNYAKSRYKGSKVQTAFELVQTFLYIRNYNISKADRLILEKMLLEMKARFPDL